jgi:transcriptional regulator with XRE-family HTH domain
MADSAAKAAREALAARLRDLRKDARLNGRQLSAETGFAPAKISRIEHASQNPTEDDIRAWAIACNAALQIPELIAARRDVEQMWREHRREMKAGLVHVQSHDPDQAYVGASLIRIYHSVALPGILYTFGYAQARLRAAARLHGRTEAEADPAANAKLARQEQLTSPTGTRFHFLVEAGALDHGFGGQEVMNEQFDFLLSVTRMPHVSFGVIPPMADRQLRGGEGFYVFDERLVRTTLWTGVLTTRRKDEIGFYLKLFSELHKQATYGKGARSLIGQARDRLSIS